MTTLQARLLVAGAVVGNAVLQALLVLPDPTPSLSPGFVLSALVSATLWLGMYAVVVGHQVARAGESLADVLGRRGTRFAAWTVGLGVVAGLAMIPLAGVPGCLVIAATPYLTLAAMGGAPNPLAVNFLVIGRAPWRFAWRIIAFAVLIVVVLTCLALNAFFVTGAPAAFVACLALGLVIWLATWSFARVYRSVA